jgi:uncharacterized protein (TIGR02453 family)
MDQAIFDFLKELKINNNREWFQEHKAEYQAAKTAFESFINDLIPRIRDFDPSIDMVTARDCAFRIYRDVRFSGDKSPYKTNMGAYIARGGKGSPMAGYYVHMEPGASFLAGGLYMPQPDVLKRVRQEIYFQWDEFRSILYDKKFSGVFGLMDDEQKLKKPPRDFPADFPGIDILKFKSFAVMHPVDDERAQSDDYLDYAAGVFGVLHPLNVFFNRMFQG